MTKFKLLKKKMIEFDFTQKDLAKAAHISEASMSAKMTGKYPFTMWEAAAIAKAMDLSPEDIGSYFCEA